MDSIRCAGCARRCLAADAVCLFCGRDPRVAAPAGSTVARKALAAGGAVMVASAIVAAPVLLAACGCGGCGAGPGYYFDTGVHADAGDAGPPDGGGGTQP